MRDRIANWLLSLGIFLLPWQTLWIFSRVTIEGEATPFGTLAIYAVEILFITAVILRGTPVLNERAAKAAQALYVLFGAGFLSLTLADQYDLGLIHLLHLIVAGALFVLVSDKRTNVRHILGVFLAGLVVPSVLGWFQIWTGTSPASTVLGLASQHAGIVGTTVIETAQGRWLRAYGSFPHPNIFGGYLAVGIVVLAWLVRFLDKKYQRLLWIPVVVLSSTLLITFSRSAWLGLIVSFLLLVLLMWRRKRMPPRHAKIIVALGAVALFSTSLIFHNQLFARFNPQLRVEAISVDERSGQYATFGDVFFSHPIIGVGPSGYVFALNTLFPGQSVWSYQPIHNTPLLILAELGLLGFAALFYFLIRVDQVNSAVSKTPGGMFGLTLGVCLLVISLFDHYLWSMWPGLALSALSLGLIVRWSTE